MAQVVPGWKRTRMKRKPNGYILEFGFASKDVR